MGVLNVTPDSFSDGGDYLSVDSAVSRASEMIAEGATIIDVGGASSRPAGHTYGSGSDLISAEEEAKRVTPVIEAIRSTHPDIFISVDTFQASVAATSIAAGADIVNDITSLRYSPDMIDVVRETGAALILMHSHGRPGVMPHEREHADVVSRVKSDLMNSVRVAYEKDVFNICIDPGFGFGKTMAENYILLNRLDALLSFGLPLLVGVSRKSMIGAAIGTTAEPALIDRRITGSVVAAALAIQSGASIVRTHDLTETVDMLKVLRATETERLV